MRTVVIYSGGLDSTVLLCHLRAKGHELKALSIDYGQRHAKEIQVAAQITQLLKIPHSVAKMSSLSSILSGSPLTDASLKMPHGHYSDENMKQTVVPNRNMLLLALGLSHAISLDYDAVAFGAHHGDRAIYPDCREEFAKAMDQAACLCDYKARRIIYPFIEMSKTEIVKLGLDLKAPLALCWSCYEGLDLHCGRCGTCNERKEAFRLAEVQDPTRYML